MASKQLTLAFLLTQPQQPDDQANTTKGKNIKRLKKSEMSANMIPDVHIHEYEGPKKPCPAMLRHILHYY